MSEEVVQKSSVELKRNSKFDKEIVVKARHEDVEVAGNAAQEEFDRLCQQYPEPLKPADVLKAPGPSIGK